jgi:hypothetical protein
MQVGTKKLLCKGYTVSWGSSVGAVSDYGLDDWELIRGRSRGFFP